MSPLLGEKDYDWIVEKTAKSIDELIELSRPDEGHAAERGEFNFSGAKWSPPSISIACKSGDALDHLTEVREKQADQANREGFDLDAMVDGDLQEPPRPMSNLTLHDLDMVLQRADSLPPGLVVQKLQHGEYAYQAPGMANPVRITTRPEYFDEHSDSLELWSPGSPFFPMPEAEAMQQELAGISIPTLLKPPGS